MLRSPILANSTGCVIASGQRQPNADWPIALASWHDSIITSILTAAHAEPEVNGRAQVDYAGWPRWIYSPDSRCLYSVLFFDCRSKPPPPLFAILRDLFGEGELEADAYKSDELLRLVH